MISVSKKSPLAHKSGLSYIPTVKDLMSDDVTFVRPHEELSIIDFILKWKKIRHLPVINRDNQLVGVVSQRDFIKNDSPEAVMKLKVSDIMSKSVIEVPETMWLYDAAKIMYDNKLGCLPVTKNNIVVGILTEADFLKAFFTWETSLKPFQGK